MTKENTLFESLIEKFVFNIKLDFIMRNSLALEEIPNNLKRSKITRRE